MSHTAIPTVALTPSRIPASRDEIGHPFFKFSGYGEAGQERILEIMHRVTDGGLDTLSLDELRIEFVRAQRSHRHGGGYPDDPNVHRMDAVLDLIRERVRARGGITGLWRGDITTLHVDVIVNAANRALAGGGGVDGAIQKAAGPELLAATLKIPEITPAIRCPVGEAILTRGFKLPASHVAHAVGPVWRGGENGEPELLASAYRASLDLAAGVGAESIAFPAISTGAYGYPQWEAAQVAVKTCEAWRLANDPNMRILLVAFDDKTVKLLRSALARFARR